MSEQFFCLDPVTATLEFRYSFNPCNINIITSSAWVKVPYDCTCWKQSKFC